MERRRKARAEREGQGACLWAEVTVLARPNSGSGDRGREQLGPPWGSRGSSHVLLLGLYDDVLEVGFGLQRSSWGTVYERRSERRHRAALARTDAFWGSRLLEVESEGQERLREQERVSEERERLREEETRQTCQQLESSWLIEQEAKEEGERRLWQQLRHEGELRHHAELEEQERELALQSDSQKSGLLRRIQLGELERAQERAQVST